MTNHVVLTEEERFEAWNEKIKAEQNDEIKNVEKEVQKTKANVAQVLNKHLMDNRIVHSDNEFMEVSGPNTNSVKTVTYRDNTGNESSRFIMKYEDLGSTITEVIAGSLYKALLYDRSPTFTLVEVSNKSSFAELKLKSKLLNDFITLCEFTNDKKEEKLLDLVNKKFASEDGKEKLAAYLSFCGGPINAKNICSKFREVNSITGQLNNIKSYCLWSFDDGHMRNKLSALTTFKNIFTEIFSKVNDKEHFVSSQRIIHVLNECIDEINQRKNLLLTNCTKLLNNQNGKFIERIKMEIQELAMIYKPLNGILERFDKEEFSEKFMTEIIAVVKNTKGIGEQLNNYANQKLNKEVQGIEKLITAMMLLGYRDLHGANMGIMKIKYEDRDCNEITENVYAKVDMSASFCNLRYTHYFQYINNFKYMLNPELDLKVKYNIDYSKLKEEINKACDLFTNDEYVESLIYRALSYKKPLLKTKEELNLIENLAEKIKIQAELLKEFANSEEFQHLKEYVASGYDDYIVWALDHNKKISGKHPIIYAIENKLYINQHCNPDTNKYPSCSFWYISPLTYILEYTIQVEDHPLSEWIEVNKNDANVKELIQLNQFRKTSYPTDDNEQSTITKITDVVKANLVESSSIPKQTKVEYSNTSQPTKAKYVLKNTAKVLFIGILAEVAMIATLHFRGTAIGMTEQQQSLYLKIAIATAIITAVALLGVVVAIAGVKHHLDHSKNSTIEDPSITCHNSKGLKVPA